MKSLRKVVFIGLCIVLLFCLISPVYATCSMVGEWTQDSFSGCINIFYPNGTCTQSINPAYYEGSNTGKWLQNGNTVTVHWNFKCCGAPQNFIDNTTLSADCNTYSGVNQYGDYYTGSRSPRSPDSSSTLLPANPKINEYTDKATGNWISNWYNKIFNPILNPINKILPIPIFPIPSVQPIPYNPSSIPTIQPIPYKPAPIPTVQPIPYRPAPIQPIQPVQPIPPYNPRF